MRFKTSCTSLGLLLAAGAAAAHPGHGADLWHTHGDTTLGIGALALTVLGAGLVLAAGGPATRLKTLRRWGWRLGAAGVALAAAMVMLHG